MPLDPLQVALTDGEKIEVLKRFHQKYQEELVKIEGELADMLRAQAEADFVQQYLGEQPEVIELRGDQQKLQKLEERRQHIGAIIERLGSVIPKQADIALKPPAQMRRY